MIISNKYRFVFVHIPKCAGTTVRAVLQVFDDRNGFYTSRVEQHEDLGRLDFVHIPLFILEQYFSSELERIKRYWTFSVLRDPYSRFPSSVSQRMKKYGPGAVHTQSIKQVKKEVDEAIAYLSNQPKKPHLLPAEYIHFQKQRDYVELNGEWVVDTLYRLDQIPKLFQDVSNRTSGELTVSDEVSGGAHANRSVVYRNNLMRSLIEPTRPATRVLTRAIPDSVRQKLRNLVYVPRDKRLRDIFESDYVIGFISDYYKEDIKLWNRLLETSNGNLDS
ncbi:sulfotransferase family 2 domain-containing protein [Aidingimonas halophila]|uniref:Sulfotransferase family protein n=1 Tax=Aidingimonas halophila TaxID=574349 RepID=A0A1H3G4P9_9GAMM|nr:sulfotransferase family 2 domain-containing protein [Aidingimonas halophila]GHC32489.1 hypothetical protein GCM10008094_26460 [Aidingimonas halophila]SDX98007.1 Sulfotransferase family protein [Aidingimonas halophila]